MIDAPTVADMTEPPRPPGDGYPGQQPDPTAPPPPTSGGGAYPPPGSGGGAYAPPPTSGGGYTPPPTSGGGGYPPAGGGYPPQGGGYPPQGGGYPPQGGGYPPQGAYYGGAGPAGFANNDEKTWALSPTSAARSARSSAVARLGWIAPLVALIAKGNESPTVRAHAVQALNFQILWSIIAIIGYITICIFIGIFIADRRVAGRHDLRRHRRRQGQQR